MQPRTNSCSSRLNHVGRYSTHGRAGIHRHANCWGAWQPLASFAGVLPSYPRPLAKFSFHIPQDVWKLATCSLPCALDQALCESSQVKRVGCPAKSSAFSKLLKAASLVKTLGKKAPVENRRLVFSKKRVFPTIYCTLLGKLGPVRNRLRA
jgi:hypothetical protein